MLDFALPPGIPLAARRWMRNLLLLPPPPSVGLALNTACGLLADTREALPDWPSLSPTNVVLRLRAKETNDTFFREVRNCVALHMMAYGRCHMGLYAVWHCV